tara:strand:+ start:75 stop:668 length:594 start_codon:yes stop_codon:yes gene_type:complete
MNNLNIALDIWKRQYETDFALLDTPQEQIEFFKDLLIGNKKKITELEEENMASTENQTKLSNLEDLQELLLSKLKIARRRLEVLPTYETYGVQKIPTELSSENTHSRKPHIFFIGHQKNLRIPKGKAWINFKSLATESKGEKEIEIHEFGKIYLKRDSSDLENTVLWSPVKFESSKDGISISKTAFDKAYDRHNTDI